MLIFCFIVKPRSHECHLCFKRFLKRQHLESHLQIHTGFKPHICHLCQNKYSSASSLRSHLANVHGIGDRPKCDLCMKTFSNPSQLKKHVLQKHEKDQRLSCSKCEKFYLRRDNLEEHVRNKHGNYGYNFIINDFINNVLTVHSYTIYSRISILPNS